jgi:raffinose/stachyose/melibiose transport system permease protein
MAARKPVRWHIAVFLAPAVLVYTAIMIIPLFGTLNLSSLMNEDEAGERVFVGLQNFATLFGDAALVGDASGTPWATTPGSS